MIDNSRDISLSEHRRLSTTVLEIIEQLPIIIKIIKERNLKL